MALSYKRLEYNTNISYMGKMRQHLLCPDLANLNAIPAPSMIHNSLYKFCTDNSAQIQWRKIVRREPEARIGDDRYISIDNIMRCPMQQRRKQETETEVIPYFFTRALNLGECPPQRQRTKLILSTDPWRKDVREVEI